MMSESTIDTDRKLLKGVRVLDLSQYIPGPYASLQLANMGAEVIKVEPPGGDPMRSFGWSEQGNSPFYQHLNRGKQIVELDLKNEAGKRKLWQLIKSADVLVEGFRPGTLERLGFAYEALCEIQPQLIVCHITGFGNTGPRAARAGHDLGYGAYAGLYAHIDPAEKPQIVFPPVADHAGALNAIAMISAALYQQLKTAKGCELDISLSQSIADWQYIAAPGELRKLISGDIAYYNFYQTRDHHFISLAAIEPKFWQAFCEAVDQQDWVPRHAEALPQKKLIADLVRLFASQPLSAWLALLDKVDCCFEPVVKFDELDQQEDRDQSLPDLQFINADNINWNKI